MSNLPNLSGSAIQDTFQRVLHTDGELIYNGTGSIIKDLPTTSSFALTSSYIETAQTASYIRASHIDQPFTSITASEDISCSGTVTMDTGLSVGRFYFSGLGGANTHFTPTTDGLALMNGSFGTSEITASGNISSSERLIANSLTLDDNTHILGGKRFTTSGGEGGEYEFRDGDLNVSTGNITASGHISASNSIEGNRLFADGHIVAADSSGDLALAFNNGTSFLIGKSNNRIRMMGEVTTSGGIVAPNIEANVNFTPNKYVGTEDSHQGDIIYYGTGTTVAGKVYYLKSTGAWAPADASQALSATSLIAIATGTDPATDGMLVRGIYHSPQGDLGTIADILYISTTAGNVNRVKPSSTGQIVRVVGYVLDNTVGLMWFDPDKTWIEL